MSIIGVNSLKVLDEEVKNLHHEISNLRVAILQLLCRKRTYKEE